MDRLAFQAVCEHSALHEAVDQQARLNNMMSHVPYHPASPEDDDDDYNDDEGSFEELDIRQARSAPYHSRAVVVPINLPMSRREVRERDRERDRMRNDEAVEGGDERDERPMAAPTTYEPTTSAARAELLKELGEPNGPEACFACRYARNQHVAPIAIQGIEKMRVLIRSSNAGGSKVALARELADFFEKHVRCASRRYQHDDEEPVPEWHAIDIYEHFFTTRHNRVDAIASTERRLLYLEQAQEAIFDEELWAMRTTPDGRKARTVKSTELAMVLKLNDAINRMYTIDPQKLKLASQDAPNLAQQDAPSGRSTRLMGAGSSFRL